MEKFKDNAGFRHSLMQRIKKKRRKDGSEEITENEAHTIY